MRLHCRRLLTLVSKVLGAGALLGLGFLIKETATVAALAVCISLAIVGLQEAGLPAPLRFAIKQ